MRLIDRYLIRGFTGPFVYCLLLGSVLFIVVDSFNNLDEFLSHHITVSIVLSYYLHLLPTLFIQIVPISALVSILYSLGNLSHHNEITALKASGVSTFQILAPYLFMGLLISFVALWVNEVVAPKSAVTSRAIWEGLIMKGKKDLKERAIKNVALYGADHRMIFAREYEVLTQTLHDVIILENNSQQAVQSKLTAKKAHYKNDRWVFEEVVKYQLGLNQEIVGEPVFSQSLSLEMPEKPDDFIREASQVDFMSAKQLRDYIHRLKGSSHRLIQRLWVDFHYKVSLPFISFIVMLLGAPLAMRTKRGSAMVGIGTSLVVIVLYYGIDSICLALGKGGHLPALLSAWFSNLLFACVGVYLIKTSQ